MVLAYARRVVALASQTKQEPVDLQAVHFFCTEEKGHLGLHLLELFGERKCHILLGQGIIPLG